MIKHCCFYFISKLFNADYELGSYYFMYHSYLYYNYVVYICSLCRNLQWALCECYDYIFCELNYQVSRHMCSI